MQVEFQRTVNGGFAPRNALWLSLAAAALTTPLGMVVSYPYVNRVDEAVLGALLSVAAGMLVYVGATHLLPEVERQRRPFAWATFAAGVATAIFVVMSK